MTTIKKLFLEQRVVPLDQMTPAQVEQRDPRGPWPVAYHVTKVVQSTELRIGDVLTRGDVDLFCKQDDWYVEIT